VRSCNAAFTRARKGCIPRIRQALDRARWKLGDIDRIEINETFAAIAIVVMRELALPEDIVNVEGGASRMVIRSERLAPC
jgi:acetyl-CoA acetyltransferase